MELIAIIAGTLGAGIGSVWIAAVLSFGVLARYTQHMLSLAAGALLSTAFLHLLPEAFESQASAHELFTVLLVGLLFFFLLDKAELWHHGHEHHHHAADPGHPSERPAHHGHDHADHPHHHHPDHGARSLTGAWSVLVGDSVHCFGDGVLIAAAFMADIRLGVVASLAVLVHEIPHHMGDLMVLRDDSPNRRMAVIKVSLAGAVTALGGVTGWFLVDRLADVQPYMLALASSSFVYVALADLIPQLQKRLSARETAGQIAWLAVGIGMVSLVSGLAHGH